MIKRKEIKVEVIEKEIELVFCDKCGCDIGFDSNPCLIKGAFVHVDFGYGSNKDSLDYEFEICDDCFDVFIKSFKFEPRKEST